MTSRLKILASSVAKLFLILFFSMVGFGQKSNQTPQPSPKSPVDPVRTHAKLHPGQHKENWWASEEIVLSSISAKNPPGILSFVSFQSGKSVALRWNDTTLVMPLGQADSTTLAGKCYSLVYCRIHLLALILVEIKCPEKK